MFGSLQIFKNLALSLQIRQWISENNALIVKIDAVERIPLLWPMKNIPPPLQSLLDKIELHLEAASALPKTIALVRSRSILIWKMLGIKYRITQHHRHSIPSYAANLSIITALALRWQQQHPIHSKESLSIEINSQLRLTALYPEFIELLLVDSAFSENFLCWLLQDYNPVEPFIQYPASQQLLVACNLSGRLQKAHPNALRIFTSCNEKYLAILVEGRYVNMLELEEHVVLKGKWVLSLKEIFDIFSEKNYKTGKLEFFSAGILNWNAHKLGYWNDEIKEYIPINLDLPEWWKQLPILETLEKGAVRQRYGFAADGKHWIAAASATRGSLTLDYENSHAFLEVAIPMHDGRYAIYDFGKVATVFPKNTLDTLIIFANSVHATIAYPDDNAYYTHRQHAQHSFPLTALQAENLMNLIKNDIFKARSKNFIYQIESENCAKWVQTTLEKVVGIDRVPNMFVMPLIETEPQSGMAAVFSVLRLFPRDLPSRILITLHIPLGAWRGKWIIEEGKKVWKALNAHPFWHTGLVYLPALLHKQRSVGSLSVVNGGQNGSLLRIHSFKAAQQNFELAKKLPMLGHAPYRALQSAMDNHSPAQHQHSLKYPAALAKAYVSTCSVPLQARGSTFLHRTHLNRTFHLVK
jgi:hypothetical protein